MGSVSSANSLTLKQLQFGFSQQQVLCALFDLELKAGTLTFVLGPNGSGKTTFLRTLAGLQKPVRVGSIAGSIEGLGGQGGKDSRGGGDGVASSYFPSQWDLDRSLTLGDLRDFFWGSLNPERYRNLSERLIKGISLDSRVALLSSGERQKALLTLILSRESEVFLLDEPQNFLEPAFALEVVEILQELSASGHTLVCATHDLGWCARVPSACGLLLRGKTRAPLFGPLTEVLRSEDFEEVFRVRVRLWHDGESTSGVAFSKV